MTRAKEYRIAYNGILTKFTNDTKLGAVAGILENRIIIQKES